MRLQRSRGIKQTLFPLLAIFLVTAGCGDYASQAREYRMRAKSDLAAAAYVLDCFHVGEVSAPFARASLREYAKTIRATSQNLRSLVPPPVAEAEHARVVAVLSRAQIRMQAIEQKGIEPREAAGLAHRLQTLAKALGP